MAGKGFVVMVEEASRGQLDRLAEHLEHEGLLIVQKLPRFRTIVGRGDAAIEPALRAVQGVEMVRPDDGFQLPPMDDKIPQ